MGGGSMSKRWEKQKKRKKVTIQYLISIVVA